MSDKTIQPELTGVRNHSDHYHSTAPLRKPCQHGYPRWSQPRSGVPTCAICPPMRVYVASSWRNVLQQGVVATLQAAGVDVYDFKHPPHSNGFHFTEVLPSSQIVSASEYLEAITEPRCDEGFNADFAGMTSSAIFVLVLPCGRSAHLELGWAVGRGLRTAVLLDDPVTPELMYKMVDYLSPSLMDLLGWLGVED